MDGYFRRDDVLLRYRDAGDGPAIIFIHGWTLDLDVWDAQCAAFAGSMRALRYDRRGFGLSGGLPDPQADVEDLAALFDHLQVARAALVGMSQGVRVALGFALRRPELVQALVLDGPPDCLEGADTEADADLAMDSLRALARSRGIGEFRRAWRAHPLMRLQTGDPAVHALLARILERYRGLDLLDTPPHSVEPFTAAELTGLRVPVLVVNGQFDTESRRQAGDRMQQALPAAERAWVRNAGHLPNLDDPRAYNAALLAFLQRRAQAAA